MTLQTAELARKENRAGFFQPATTTELIVGLAFSPEDVRAAQRLRHRVLAEETDTEWCAHGLDADAYDPYCQQVIVRDLATGEVVASTRVLIDHEARLAGGFHAETAFDISPLMAASERTVEMGSICVHPDYRSGSATDLLWSGFARFIDLRPYRHVIGCSRVSMGDNGANATAAWKLLEEKHLLPESLRVIPRLPLPERERATAESAPHPVLPPALRESIRLGARIGGAPCWEPSSDCANFLFVLSPSNLQKRYAGSFRNP